MKSHKVVLICIMVSVLLVSMACVDVIFGDVNNNNTNTSSQYTQTSAANEFHIQQTAQATLSTPIGTYK